MIWGLEVNTNVQARIVRPSKERPGTFDTVKVGLRDQVTRFNPGARIPITRTSLQREAPVNDHIPLDPVAFQRYGSDVLPEFCSQTDLSFETVQRPNGTFLSYMVNNTIGYAGTVSLASGRAYRQGGFLESSDRYRDRWMMTWSTPAVLSVHLYVVHRSMAKNIQFYCRRWGTTPTIPIPQKLPDNLSDLDLLDLPFSGTFSLSGSGASAAEVPEVKKFAPLVTFGCSSQGWDIEEFDIYQQRVPYTLLSSVLIAEVTFLR